MTTKKSDRTFFLYVYIVHVLQPLLYFSVETLPGGGMSTAGLDARPISTEISLITSCVDQKRTKHSIVPSRVVINTSSRITTLTDYVGPAVFVQPYLIPNTEKKPRKCTSRFQKKHHSKDALFFTKVLSICLCPRRSIC